MIMSSRFYLPLVLGQSYAASGTISHASNLPAGGSRSVPLTKGQVVESGDWYSQRANAGAQNFDNRSGVISYDGDIVLKRFRLYANLPGAFYSSSFNTLGLCWSHDQQNNTLDWTQNLCHWTTIPVINVGEWVDINVVLPRSNALLKNFGDNLYSHSRIGAWFSAGTYYYANVPTAMQGQGIYFGLELETALTVEPRTWEGDTK